MIRFRSMGCEVVVSDRAPADSVRALFDDRDRRFSRFIENSELSSVNATPLGVALVSEELASMLAAALVLVATDRRMVRAATFQGLFPLIALIALVLV